MDEELGILRFVYDRGAVCAIEQAKENVKIQLEASGGRVVPILCDISKVKVIDHESRVFYGESPNFRALALVTASPIGNIIGNVFLAVYGKRETPTKLFTSESDAINWLKEFVQ
jgi:hypothetical protein